MADGISISARAASCNNLFQKLCELSKTHSVKNYPKNLSIEREYDRFSLWARNIAALQDARYPSSLGYRIRHDSRAQTLVENALKYLEESLQMAIPIVSGEEPNETWDITDPMAGNQYMSDGDDNSDQQQQPDASMQSELDELFTAIQGGVTHLFRLSMIIRKKPETDEYVKAASKFPIDPTSDIVHVKDKHSTIPVEHSWLSERLGTAITSRRQYLIFRREHQKKLSEIHHLKTSKDGGTSWSGTRASTHDNTQGLGTDKPIQLSISTARNIAQTLYADSSKGNDGSSDLLRTPLLPKNNNGIRYQYGDHFECPFCWRPQEVKSKTEWKKHVFSDLRPYVCTFESCNSSIFESQNAWFKHELDNHRRQWSCILCDDRGLKPRRELESHLSEVHSDPQKKSLPETIKQCLYPRISALDCPLCNEYGERLQKVNDLGKCDVSLKQFQQHLGRHMEQLALSALPTSDRDSDESEENTDDTQDEIDTMPRLKLGKKGTITHATHLMSSGKMHENLGELDQAESFYQRAFEIFSKVVGSEHLSTIESMEHLGIVYMRKEMFTKAEEIFESALSIKERLLGVHEPSTLSTAHHLGKVYMSMNRLDKAEKMLHWAAQFSATEATIDLGVVYMERGKLNEAEECFLLSAKRYEIDLGADHPDTLNALDKLRLIRTQISPQPRQVFLKTKIESDQALRLLRSEEVRIEQELAAEQQPIEQRIAEHQQLDHVSVSALPSTDEDETRPPLDPASAPRDTVQATSGSLEDESYTIKCICGFSDDDGNTIYCETCDTWQHIECFYPGDIENVSREDFDHSCADCKPRPLNRRNARERQTLQRLERIIKTSKELAPVSDKGKWSDAQRSALTSEEVTSSETYKSTDASSLSDDISHPQGSQRRSWEDEVKRGPVEVKRLQSEAQTSSNPIEFEELGSTQTGSFPALNHPKFPPRDDPTI